MTHHRKRGTDSGNRIVFERCCMGKGWGDDGVVLRSLSGESHELRAWFQYGSEWDLQPRRQKRMKRNIMYGEMD